MATGYVLDTNVLVALIRNDSIGQYVRVQYDLLCQVPIPAISIVTEAELFSLAAQWGWSGGKREDIRFFTEQFQRMPIDRPELVEAFVAIDSFSRSRGRRMGKHDIWIAATAHILDRTLLTTDADFDHLHPKMIDMELIRAEETRLG